MLDTPLFAELLSQLWFRFLPLIAAPFLLPGVLSLGYGPGGAMSAYRRVCRHGY